MLGHKQIIELRKKHKKPKTVFVHIAPHPEVKHDYQDPEKAVIFGELISVYTGSTNPKKADLSWVKGLQVQLIACNSGIEEFVSWWIAIIDAEPKSVIGLDTDGEVNLWKE
jgi:hypothetical protein